MFVGIDLGTSGVKLLLVNKHGEILKTISKSYDLIMPKALWVEQDPYQWYEQTLCALKEIVQGYEHEILGLSFSGQMHGLVILDDQDQVLRNALLWNDQRTTEEVDYLNQEIGIKKLLELTGNIAVTGLTAPKILWIKKHEPEIFKKISKIMLPKDYLAYKLSGVFASDVSDSSGTLYYDVKNKCYSKEMLRILNIRNDQLPKVYESYETIGQLKSEIASILKINQPVDIIIGGGDQAVGAVGIGIVKQGSCSISLGTSGVVFVSSESFKVDDKNYLQSYAHANGKYHLMGVMLNAAGSLKWWHESIFKSHDYKTFFERLSTTPIDDSIFFLPYLMGERSPINDPYATGVFMGLRLEHRKENMDRAVIEGVTFALKETFELIKDLDVEINSIRITGGGAKNSVWVQMIADIIGVDVITVEAEEGPAFGAAILAMVGTKTYKTVEQACEEIVNLKSVYRPNIKNSSIYNKKYEKFKRIYPSIKDLL